MHLKGRLHLGMDPPSHRAKGTGAFWAEGRGRGMCWGQTQEKNGWKVASPGAHYARYHLGFFLSPQ